jgi:hypothetical protein
MGDGEMKEKDLQHAVIDYLDILQAQCRLVYYRQNSSNVIVARKGSFSQG